MNLFAVLPVVACVALASAPATAAQSQTPPSVLVTGEVRAPGKIIMPGPAIAVLEAIALAGGPTTNAGDEVTISHRPQPGAVPEFVTIVRRDLERGTAGLDVTLQDGDIVNLPAVKRYYITGSVKKPGSYPLHAGLTVSQAILLAGGLAGHGSDKGIRINRYPHGRSAKPLRVDARADEKVLPGDEINIRGR